MQKEFPDVSKAAWLAKVEKDLKGKPLDSLNFSVKGETFSPFWHREDLVTAYSPLKTSSGWKIGAHITEQDISQANKLALEALSGGANALWFSRYRPLSTEQKNALLDGIYLDIIECVIDEEEMQSSQGSIAVDLWHAAKTPKLTPTFCLNRHADFFTAVAHYRAVRACWQQITAAYQLNTPCKLAVFLHVAGVDENSNKISSSVDAITAAVGGADSIYVQPSDGHGDTNFYRRIARNIHHLMLEESHLGIVADPVAGSYYLENLTDTIARRIWSEFQAVGK